MKGLPSCNWNDLHMTGLSFAQITHPRLSMQKVREIRICLEKKSYCFICGNLFKENFLCVCNLIILFTHLENLICVLMCEHICNVHVPVSLVTYKFSSVDGRQLLILVFSASLFRIGQQSPSFWLGDLLACLALCLS
jgi:hypothetical protein